MTQNFEPTAAALSNNHASSPITSEGDETAEGTTSSESSKNGFERFGFCPNINDAIAKSGYTVPTPIQERAIPILMEGRDVLGIAQTGTGKTAAFALPILEKIMASKFRGIQALILVPTRELAQQVCAAFTQLAGRSSVRATTIFGGQSFGLQVKALRGNPDVIVACPGRLLDHVERRTIRLDTVSMLVLDEADQMFDMGFLPTVRQILQEIPKERQSMLFSATMPSEIKSLAMEVLLHPETVQVASQETAATIHHKLFGVTQAQKTDLLIKLLKDTPSDSVLVFARTKQRTKRLQDALYKGGLSATSLQGNLSQQQREKSMKGFRAGKFRVMVATDIASRGIDVASIGLVVNFDMPLTTETYTHRVGRTGRALRSGTAVTLACPEDRSMVRLLERRLKVGFEHGTIEGFDRVDLSGGNADEASAPQFGRRSGGGSRFGGGRSGGGQGGRRFGGGGRGNFRGGDRSQGDRPRDDRPFSDRPQGERSESRGEGRSGGYRGGQRSEGFDRYAAPAERSEYAPRGRSEGSYGNSARPDSRSRPHAGSRTSSHSATPGNSDQRGPRSYGSQGGSSRPERSGGGSRFGGSSRGPRSEGSGARPHGRSRSKPSGGNRGPR